jgi:hypothetical protein
MSIIFGEYYHLADHETLPDGTYLQVERDAYKAIEHAYGYYVAYTNPHLPKSAYTVTEPSQFRDAVHRVVTDDGFLGVWTDDEGVTWVEQSFWIEHRHPAEALGRAWHQIAIWDCAEGVAINL